MYFCQKLFSMKEVILYTLLFFAISVVGSCGIYEKQCPGVGEVKVSEPNT